MEVVYQLITIHDRHAHQQSNFLMFEQPNSLDID